MHRLQEAIQRNSYAPPAEKIKGDKTNWTKIGKAAVGGAVAGAITGLAGPEAGLAAKMAISATGQVVGGGVERCLNGEKVLDPKEMAEDAGAGAAGNLVEGPAERSFASKTIQKVVPAVIETAVDAGRRGADAPTESQTQQPQPQPQQPKPQPTGPNLGTVKDHPPSN